MERLGRRIIAVGVLAAVGAAGAPADALGPGTLTCQLAGGNGIVLAMQLTPEGAGFAVVGRWDDASLSPLLPVYGAVLEDPNFGVVGGLTRVGFTGRPQASAPFGVRPRGDHVQFRLTPVGRLDFSGQWADDAGGAGTMACVAGGP